MHMFDYKSNILRLSGERILSPQAFLKLLNKNRSSIESATFIPPVLGSDNISGSVRVKLKPGYSHVIL